jgi:hypothetical protein
MKSAFDRFWTWWRERVTFEQKAGIAVLCFGLVLVAGWMAADQLPGASATVSPNKTGPVNSTAFVKTVKRVVTIRDRTRPVTTLVRVVKPMYRTRTDTLPGTTVVRTQTTYGTSTVTVPRYVTHVVTAPAHTITESETVTDPTTTVEWRVVTVVEKSKPVTVTVQGP